MLKKNIILVLVLLMVVQSCSFTFANKFLEVDVVELVDGKDGSTSEYKVVNLLVDGDDVFADVPSILYNLDGKTRTLVPISFITEKIGAEIEWYGDTREVKIIHNGKEILLKIDSNIALVNGKSYELPNGIPAKLMSYEGTARTMVPVNFVSQHLGYDIFWIGETRTVSINRPQQTLSAMRYDDSGTYPELRFKVSGDVSMTSYSVDGKSVGGEDALILEFHNTSLNLTNPPTYGRYVINDMVQEVFDVQLTEGNDGPTSVKAVVGLGYYRNGDIKYDASTGEMVVQLINSVNYVDVEEVNQATAVVIDTTENPAYNVTKLSDRVYIDIIHSKLSEEANTIEVNDKGIEKVSYTQVDNSDMYDAGTRFARITVNLDGTTSADQVYVDNEGSKVYVYVQDNLYGTYSYARNVENATSEFALNLVSPSVYPVTYAESSRTLTFSVPKANVNLTTGTDNRDDGVLNSITVSESGDVYNIKMVLAENTSYVETKSDASQFKIAFTNQVLKNSEYKEKLIVIDAGHGGHDPGALNGNYLEKDVALEASLILKRKLENAGFKVYMTRERDNYVKLYDRAGIANQLDADMFISIHINAASNTKAKGLETLYAPDLLRDNETFARAIQNQLINHTGGVNRGVVARPELVVIRETEMDAVLVELGFISNEEDRAKLTTEAYLETCAEAILDGVIDFID